MQYVILYQDCNGVVMCVVKYILLLLLKYHVCIINSIHLYASMWFVLYMSMFTYMVPDPLHVIIVVITNQLVVSCDMLYHIIPVTDGDTAPSSSQVTSTTPQDAVKISPPVVGK